MNVPSKLIKSGNGEGLQAGQDHGQRCGGRGMQQHKIFRNLSTVGLDPKVFAEG